MPLEVPPESVDMEEDLALALAGRPDEEEKKVRVECRTRPYPNLALKRAGDRTDRGPPPKSVRGPVDFSEELERFDPVTEESRDGFSDEGLGCRRL